MTKAIKYLLIILGIFLSLSTICILSKRRNADFAPLLHSRQWTTMSTIAEYKCTDKSKLDDGAKLVRETFSKIESQLSIFNPTSQISILNTQGTITLPIKPGGDDPDLLFLINEAVKISHRTSGAFDPTVAPLMRLWGFRRATRTASMPTDTDLHEALSHVGYQKIILTTNENSTVTIKLIDGAKLDLGGIAKGYAVDLAYDRLVGAGLKDFIINLGGNIRVNGTPPQGSEWQIAIRDPDSPDKLTDETLSLKSGEAVATSGSYERYVVIDGKRYSHIIDPRTGHPVERTGSVSVKAKSALEADALSTAVFVGM